MTRITLAAALSLFPAALGCATVSLAAPTDFSTESVAQSKPAAAPGREPDNAALAKQLSNPVAALISFPMQLNYDKDIGPADGKRWTLNVQPVVPFSLNEDWNLISRTIVPLMDQSGFPAGDNEAGVGDVTQSLFLSPVKPTQGGWVWGVGPVFLLPTATEDALGADQWGLGPTVVALKQEGPWTYGALFNHIWSVAGDSDRPDVDATFFQPFAAYTTHDALTFTLNLESTYDWKQEDYAVPANALVSKVVKFGSQLVSIGGGLRYWVGETDASPEGWGFRFFVTLLFPK